MIIIYINFRSKFDIHRFGKYTTIKGRRFFTDWLPIFIVLKVAKGGFYRERPFNVTSCETVSALLNAMQSLTSAGGGGEG